jgi:2,4-dienoyl-CoA reductase-like NADH-dependent reductase (Old Yellow Enzyme family)
LSIRKVAGIVQSQNNKPELIVMLTRNDMTVPHALELFQSLRDTPVTHWGFKDMGLPIEQMKRLVESMKEAGKVTYLEVVSLSEAEGLQGARLAVETGFDVLMGTVFFETINEYMKDKPVCYYPFPGRVHSHPSILDGTIEAIVADARRLEAHGVDGMDLLTYRYAGDAPRLLREVVQVTRVPIVSAGSIASFERIAEVWEAGAWGFTIGSAFFESRFVPGGSFEDNVMAVWNWLESQ